MKKKVQGKTVRAKLVRNKLKSADKAPYFVRAVPVGTMGLDDLLRNVAEHCGITVAESRLFHDAMFEVLRDELQQGHKVETPFGLFEPAISGSVPFADSPPDPEKNKLYVKITPTAAIRREIAKLVPVVEGGPASALAIAEVFTGSLGAKGYNAVVAGENFVLTGDGFLEDGELSATLVDAKGATHEVAIASRKKTALVCAFAGPAAKGKAVLEVVLAGEAPDVFRFTASRKVTVR